ncbi:MAG: hypothetical protein HXX09_00735 [Bacteroidetes bacterium]|nr:hypothetical protein [Bacteroidota bacterium]
MSKTAHRIFIFSLVIIVLVVLALIWNKGVSFYKTTIEERFFHSDYKSLKPSGIIGHGYGILGSFFMLMGVVLYMLRKRFRTFSRLGILKHWLEFHIFLCTLGPILVLFHTSFKFGGIVAISFWSMVAVFLSGIIGRFIYIQIPRTIEGRELSLSEVMNLKTDVGGVLNNANLDEVSFKEILELTKQKDRSSLKKAKLILKKNNVAKVEYNKIVNLLKNEISLNRKIDRLSTMQNLLKYWHVAHLPFAFVMLIVMIVHVVITLLFGYKWIF